MKGITLKNISRQKYRSKKTWSWLVRVNAARPNGLHKYFYDRDYGGSRKAKAAAIECLEKAKKRFPAYYFAGKKGVTWGKGVSLRWIDSYYNGTTYSYLNAIAQWNDRNAKRNQKTFSCTKYGIEGAKKLAKNYREKMLRELGYTKVRRYSR